MKAVQEATTSEEMPRESVYRTGINNLDETADSIQHPNKEPLKPLRLLDQTGSYDQEMVGILRVIQLEREMRQELCPELAASEASWALACDLYLSFLEKEQRDITAVCAATLGSPSTALRWLNHLEMAGMTIREQSLKDKRVQWVSLSNAGLFQINRWMKWVRDSNARREVQYPVAR